MAYAALNNFRPAMHGINGGLMLPNTCVGELHSFHPSSPRPRSDLIFKVFIIYTLNLSILISSPMRSHMTSDATAIKKNRERERE